MYNPLEEHAQKRLIFVEKNGPAGDLASTRIGNLLLQSFEDQPYSRMLKGSLEVTQHIGSTMLIMTQVKTTREIETKPRSAVKG